MGYVAGVIALLLTVVFYCLPLIVAKLRHHPDQQRITGWNILTGWSMIGWIACLVWALRPVRARA